MLAEAGAKLVIVGHSERRTDNHETDAEVKAKASAAIAGGLVAPFASERRKPSGTLAMQSGL